MVAERTHSPLPGIEGYRVTGPLLIVADTDHDALMLESALRTGGFSEQILFTTGFEETVRYFSRVTRYADPSVYPEPGMVLLATSRLEFSHLELLTGLEVAWKIPTLVLTVETDIQFLRRRARTRYLPRPSEPDELVQVLREAVGNF